MPSPRSLRHTWEPEFPSTLVVACSDGRFTWPIADFVHDTLKVPRFDQLIVPGGGGALVDAGGSARARQLLGDAHFLIEAHQIEQVVLFFHGPAADGPEDALCGDYRRRFPKVSPAGIRTRQDADAAEVIRRGFGLGIRVLAYRCEVSRAEQYVFIPLHRPAG